MFGPPVAVRCPSCGARFAPPAPPTFAPAWVGCPSCHRPMPVLRPRVPAPLFTWEAFPHLYPYLTLPRPAGPRFRPIAAALLIAVAALLALGAAGLVVQGGLALPDHAYHVGGHVLSSTGNGRFSAPIAGARVNLTGENGFSARTVTDAEGAFSFPRVPSGGITLNVTAPGFAPAEVVIFLDPVYSSPAGDAGNLTVRLTPSDTLPQGSLLVDTPFSDLEQFVATLWSGGIILAVGAAVAAAGAVRTLRRERYAWGVAGGMAGALAPVALVELGVGSLFPTLELLGIVIAAVGLTVAVLLTLLLAATRGPEPSERVPPPPAE